MYDEKSQQQVSFILKAKELGLSLDEIKELLEIRLEATEHSCAEVKAITSAKLAVIDQKIEELTRIRSALKKSMMPAAGMWKITLATARFSRVRVEREFQRYVLIYKDNLDFIAGHMVAWWLNNLSLHF